MQWYLKVVKNYVGFSGRAHRTEFWMFVLINLLIMIGLCVVDSVTGTFNAATGYGLTSGLYSLAVLLPSLAVSIRRLHDTGRSGWWLLIILIPLLGAIAMLVFYCLDSDADNQFGPNPKES